MFLHNLALHDGASLLGGFLFTLFLFLFLVHFVQGTHTQERNDQRNTGQDERNETNVVNLTDQPQRDVVFTLIRKVRAVRKGAGGIRINVKTTSRCG
jgi:hypothetical protein